MFSMWLKPLEIQSRTKHTQCDKVEYRYCRRKFRLSLDLFHLVAGSEDLQPCALEQTGDGRSPLLWLIHDPQIIRPHFRKLILQFLPKISYNRGIFRLFRQVGKLFGVVLHIE